MNLKNREKQISRKVIYSIQNSRNLIRFLLLYNKNEGLGKFIKVFNSLQNFRGEASLNTWIYRIATNTVIDRLKSNTHKFSKVQHELTPTTLHYNNSQYSSTFEKQLEKQEMNDCIRQFINELTAKNRDVFLLSQYEGFSNGEISEILNISIDSVKIRLHRAKETLKTLLTKNCNIYFDDHNALSCEPVSFYKT